MQEVIVSDVPDPGYSCLAPGKFCNIQASVCMQWEQPLPQKGQLWQLRAS